MYAINKGERILLIPVFPVEVSRFISKEVSETLLYICLSHINDGANIIRIFKLRSLVSHFFSFFFVFFVFCMQKNGYFHCYGCKVTNSFLYSQ